MDVDRKGKKRGDATKTRKWRVVEEEKEGEKEQLVRRENNVKMKKKKKLTPRHGK